MSFPQFTVEEEAPPTAAGGYGGAEPPPGAPPVAAGFPGDPNDPDALFAAAQEATQLPQGWTPGEIEDRLDSRLRLTEDERTDLGQRLGREFYFFEEAFADRRSNAASWRDDASMMPDYPITDARDGQTDEHAWMSRSRSPLTSVACRSAWQKLVQQILTPHPPFVAIAEEPTAVINQVQVDLVQEAPRVEEAWESLWDEAGAREAYRELFDEITVVSPAAMLVQWERETVWVPDRTVRQDEEQLGLLLESGQVDPRDAYWESFDTDSAGLPNARIKWREKVIRDGARFTVIPFEDLVWFPASARHAKDAFAVGQRVRMRGDFLKEHLNDQRNGYFTEAIEDLLARPSDGLTETEQEMQDRAAMSADVPTSEDREEHREYACIKLAYRGRLGGEKGDRWYWLLFHPPTSTLLQACYMLDRHGLCPYTIYNYLGSKLVGMSLAELNAVSQKDYSTALGNFQDLTSILVGAAGNFLVDAEASGFDINEFTLTPGRAWKCRNPKDTVFPLPIAANIPQALGHLVGALELLKSQSQLLTSTSNVSLGKEAESQTTATEIRTVFAQDQAISEVMGFGVALGCAQDLEKFRQIIAQYCRKTLQRYTSRQVVEGADGASELKIAHLSIQPELLAAAYKIVPAGLTASSSAQARYQKASLVLQTVQTNPLTMNIPTIQFDALESLLEAAGEPQTAKWIAEAKQAYQAMMEAQAKAAAARSSLLAEATEPRPEGKPLKPGEKAAAPDDNAQRMMAAVGAAAGGGGGAQQQGAPMNGGGQNGRGVR